MRALITLTASLLILLCAQPSAPAAAGPASIPGQIMIDLRTNRLRYYRQAGLAGEFPVATGQRPGWTPEGAWQVVRMAQQPSWRNPQTREVVPGGIPENPLGSRWLGLNARGTDGYTYGIHGTNQPVAIGRYVSAGCVRMHNADVEWLYAQVQVGTRVDIFRSRPHPPPVRWPPRLVETQTLPGMPHRHF